MKHTNKADGNINSDRQETDAVNRDEEISACFERAKKKLDRLLTSKKRVIRDLAGELERLGRRTEDIAAEIVAELSGCGEISKSLIYEYLDDKYKNAAHASRRKGKKTKKPVPETGTEPETEVPPLVIKTSASGQEVVESTSESQVETKEIGSSGDNTDTSPPQSEQQNNSKQSSTFESKNHTDQKLLPSSSPQHIEWRECSFPFDDVRNMVSQAASENQDKFCFCVKLDRPATILDLRLGRLNGEDSMRVMTEQERNHDCKFYCVDCFAYIESECFCDRIVGYDAETGYPIVDVTEEDWAFLHNKMVSKKGGLN